jgi:hypothetical protein
MLEEEIFYPACREHMDDEMLDEAQVEHDGAKILINEILSGSPDRLFYDAKVKVLSEMIKHHVNEEEKRNEGIFAKAKAGGVDVDEIARRLKARKAELVAHAEEGGLERPRPRSFVNATEMERNMPREQSGKAMSAAGSKMPTAAAIRHGRAERHGTMMTAATSAVARTATSVGVSRATTTGAMRPGQRETTTADPTAVARSANGTSVAAS